MTEQLWMGGLEKWSRERMRQFRMLDQAQAVRMIAP